MRSLRHNVGRGWRRLSFRCVVLPLLAASAAAPCARGESRAERVERMLATYDSFDAEVANQLAVARLDLAAVRPEDGWLPGQKEAALAWLDALVQTGVYTRIDTPLGGNRTQVHFRAVAPHHLEPPAAPWGDKVTERLRALELARQLLGSDLTDEAVKYADPLWSAAKAPADLLPAAQLLRRVKTEVVDKLPNVTFNSANAPFPNPGSSGTTRTVLVGEDVRGLALFILTPEPLIFPEPETNPAEYIRLRLLWAEINAWKLSILMRSSMTFKVRDYDQRLKRAALAGRRHLDQLILLRAPAEDLGKAIAQLEAFRIPAPPTLNDNGAQFSAVAMAKRLHTIRQPHAGEPSPIRDYRDLPNWTPTVSGSFPPYPDPLYPVIPPETLDAYRAAVDLLIAAAAPTPPDSAPAVEIRRKLSRLDPDLRAALGPLLSRPHSPENDPSPFALPKPDSAASASSALAGLLESIVHRFTGNVPSAADRILTDWRSPEPLEATPEILNVDHAESWMNLETVPGSPVLFAARDATSRELLAKICGPIGADSLPIVVREQLEKGVTAADFAGCRKVLAVDQWMAILPAEEHRQWTRLVALFEKAGTATVRKQAEVARSQYRQILSLTCSDSAGKVAARLLKALSPPAPPPQP